MGERENRKRSPQEKKRLSLEKDRRNTYGENDKASRKLIPLSKKLANRKVRRGARTDLASGSDQIESRDALRRLRKWQKAPDDPLKDVIKSQEARRAERAGARIERRHVRAAEARRDET